MNAEKAHEILRAIPYEKGFHFFSPDGHYTGQTATTLCFFLKNLQHIGVGSVRFHFERGDFQKWLRTTVGDEDLAEKIDAIDKRASDEALLAALSAVIERRVETLKSFML